MFNVSSFSLKLSQGTIDYLGHLGLGVFLLHAMGDTAVDIRHFETLDTLVGDVGHEVDVVDVELTVFLTFRIDLTEEFDLSVVEMLAHLLYHPDVTEELSTQVTIAYYRLTDHAQVGVDQFDDLVLRTDLTGGHLVEFVAQALQFTLDDGIVNLLL